MSVIVTLHVKADGTRLESWAGANEDVLSRVIKKAEGHGLIAHRFYSDGQGNVMVLDEWPDAERFRAFFRESQDDIAPMMAAVGVQQAPQISFWNELETPDRYGWGVEAHAAH